MSTTSAKDLDKISSLPKEGEDKKEEKRNKTTEDKKSNISENKSNDVVKADGKKSEEENMHLPLTNTHTPANTVTSTSSQHSPGGGSTSSASSNGSNVGGYTRQSNPRPRKYNNSTISQTSVSATTPSTFSSSLPPSAVSAPPYVPPQAVVMDYNTTHGQPPLPINCNPISYYDSAAGTYIASPTMYYPAYPDYAAPTARGGSVVPPPPPPPPPSGANVAPPLGATSTKVSGGRYTPSPHSVSGSSSPSSFCQNGTNSAGANQLQQQQQQQQHVVNYHIHQGEAVTLQMGDGTQFIPGPATIRMVSTNSSPPVPMPMSVPPGHMVQQILDQNGTLQHVILSLDPLNPPGSGPAPNGGYVSNPGQGAAVVSSPIQPQPYANNVVSAQGTGTGVNTSNASARSGIPGSTRGGPPFAPNTVQYGPPPVAPILSGNTNGPSPPERNWPHPPGYPSGGVSVSGPPSNHSVRVRGPTHERLIKKAKGREQQQHHLQPQQQGPPQHGTPVTSPAKRGMRVGGSPYRGGKSPTPFVTSTSPHHVHSNNPNSYNLNVHHSISSAAARHVTAAASYFPAGQTFGSYGPNLVVALPQSHSPYSPLKSRSKVTGFRQPDGNFRAPSSPGNLKLSSPVRINTVATSSGNSAGNNGGGNNGKDSRHDDSEESGVGHEEEEEVQQLLIELLSNMRTPGISQVTARSALLSWGPPIRETSEGSKFEALEPVSESELKYEVMLSDKGKEGKYRKIFSGESIECKLTDLKPNTPYHIRIHALYDVLKGGASDTVSFLTESCEPDAPFPPKLVSRTKTSISLRWNAPLDNGSHIQQYILESDEGQGSHNSHHFVECFVGRTKSYTVTKLSSSTNYRFRLIAVNDLGRSRPSEAVVFNTQGTAPPAPQAPGLKEATKSSLHLAWAKRVCDEEFVLQMDDRISGHGFLTCYNGPNVYHLTTGLRRNTSYRFRLQAHNDEGKSVWSEEVSYMTLPDVPGPPLRPASKGRLHPHSFKVRWDPPADNGGSPVTSYILELDNGSGWQTLYQGSDLECICDNLFPGTQYKVRVACASEGGFSQYSEICYITTEPVCPGQCAPPRVHGKPKSNSLHLKWGWPETDGGSPVTEFEIDMTSPDNRTQGVYRGHDTECVVASLLPGRPYLFQVRAHNRAGPGPWSESLEVVSGAGSPDQPKEPKVTCKSGTVAVVNWEAPINNGAIIKEYQLQIALIRRTIVKIKDIDHYNEEDRLQVEEVMSDVEQSEDDNDDDLDDEEEGCQDDESPDSDDEAETAPNSRSESRNRSRKKNLRSRSSRGSTTSAHNNHLRDSDEDDDDEDDDVAVAGKKSRCSEGEEKNQDEALVNICMEDIEGEPQFVQVYSGSGDQCEVKSLEPASGYLFRICAINSAGPSIWSDNKEITTPAAPPSAIAALKLRRSDSSSLTVTWSRPQCNGEPITHYNVDTGSRIVPTRGPDTIYTIENLKPDTPYNIRIQAVNGIGPGPFSCVARLCTRPLPPAPPKCECVNANHNSLKLKWGDAKASAHSTSVDLYQYILEMENVNTRNIFHQVYSGSGVSHKVNKLNENTKYRFRICASNEAGQGPFSSVMEFTTAFAHPPPVKNPPRVTSITQDGCLVEWSAVRMPATQPGDIHYKVQLTKNRDLESKMVYTGSDQQWRVNGLDSKTDYTIRVAAVRVAPAHAYNKGLELIGSYSPPCVFSTLSGTNDAQTNGQSGQTDIARSTESRLISSRGEIAWSDQQWALVILVGFTTFAVLVAIIVQQVMA